ncbi:UPF0669 protein C6orf120 homolog [Parasteatoda tepidariorum]|nr:UPF0669 protein C6orf120 homolog [Parasteatoda tepidariorum]XP_015906649.1 UPF0669 protein C6orf120 homolog [Parasteatoda tepidariorum]XP_015906650.1 UPF0669 protein C6orf120 homolog [Parasteatoda tepidariorum]
MMGKARLVLFFLFLNGIIYACAEHFHETLLGAVGGGNYSYYRLSHTGTVVLQLNSLEGDADLYVSSGNLKPTYDIENHEWQSTTCGTEHVRVASHYERPLTIAVYGHPSHEISLYELKIDVYETSADEESIFDEVSYQDDKPNFSKPTSIPNLNGKDEPEYEEKSVFWTLLWRILHVLLDLLVD